jgi:hypothetical protein
MKPEQAFTMAEAAELIPMSRRKLQDFVKLHAFYYENGTRKMFLESDIAKIRAVMRKETEERREKEAQCLSSSSRHAKAKRRSIPSVGRTSGSMWTEVQRRLTKLRQGDSSDSGKRKSNVVALPGPANPRSSTP